MSYLRGPLTKEQVATLTEHRSKTAPFAPGTSVEAPAAAPTAPAPELADDESSVAPPVAAGTPVSYLDPAAAWAAGVGAVAGSTRLRAFLAARVSLRYDDSAAGVDEQAEFEAVYGPLDGGLDLASETQVDYDERDFAASPPSGGRLRPPHRRHSARRGSSRSTAKDIQRHLVDRRPLELQRNRALKLVARPGETPEEFAARCDAAAQERADAETAKIRDRLEAKRDRLEKRARAGASGGSTSSRPTRARAPTTELVAGAGAVLGALFGGRRSTRSMASAIGGAASRRGVTARTAERRRSAEEKADTTKDDLAELEQEILDEVAEIDEKWRATADEIDTLAIRLEATDVRVLETRIVWAPSD